jgi:methionyl-tRNA formyltransferase
MLTRIVFMGSPDFALPTLRRLNEVFSVVGVVTQPDRPAGRGRTLTPPPVKSLANELDLPVIQPASLNEQEAKAQLRSWEPNLIVVVAFGQILRQDVLDLPQFGSINVHASLLPRWRGAAPIQAAILHGDSQTGVTIMKMDSGVDTGPLLSQQTIPLLKKETAGSLSPKLAKLGADLLIETLPAYLKGDLTPQPQQGEATYAHMLKKVDGELDLARSAQELERKVRAYDPWPGTYIDWRDGRLKILQARTVELGKIPGSETSIPDTRTIIDQQPALVTGDGVLILEMVQPVGKKPMPGEVFLRGARDWRG